MAGTPKRKSIAASTSSPAASLIGSSVLIPPEIFAEDDVQYTGKVIGTPSRRKNAVYVKVDQDATQYWFPVSEVSKWVVDNKSPTATTSTPKSARQKRKHVAESSQQTPTASQTADADDQTVPQAAAPHQLTMSDSPAAAVHLHDASSSHPQPQQDLTDTVEGLAATSAQELHHMPAAVQSIGIYSIAAFAAVIPLLFIVWGDLYQHLQQYTKTWR